MEVKCWHVALALISVMLMSSSLAVIDHDKPNQPINVPTNYTISNQQPTMIIHSNNGDTFVDNFSINGTIWDDDFPS